VTAALVIASLALGIWIYLLLFRGGFGWRVSVRTTIGRRYLLTAIGQGWSQ
jgi:hypothetical protein